MNSKLTMTVLSCLLVAASVHMASVHIASAAEPALSDDLQTSHACSFEEVSAHAQRIAQDTRRQSYEPGEDQFEYMVIGGSIFLNLVPMGTVLTENELLIITGRILRHQIVVNPVVVKAAVRTALLWAIPAAVPYIADYIALQDPSTQLPTPALPDWVRIPLIRDQAETGQCMARRHDVCEALAASGLSRHELGPVCR